MSDASSPSGSGGKKRWQPPPPTHAGHPEEGEGNWLVSYADMMTLLVGFFVILLSFSSVDEGKMEEVKQSLTREFGGVYQVPYGDLSNRIKEAMKKLGLGDQFVIKETDSGVEISFLGAVFFDSGSTELKKEGQVLLDKLIEIIRSEHQSLTKNKAEPKPEGKDQKISDFKVTIEGHTDDVPIVSKGLLRSNWDLSSLRACRVLEAFYNAGFEQDKLTAVGYGDTRPIAPNRDQNGTALPNNQSQNRRVVIRLQKSEILIRAAPPSTAQDLKE